MRHGANCFDVLSDVIADKTVATGSRIFQPAFFIHHRHGDPVDFRLDHHRNFLVRQQTSDSFVKIRDLFFGIGIIEAKHRRAVLDLRKCFKRLSTYALRWRIGREEVGKLRFVINELLVEPVVLAVTDDGRGILVIQPVVLANFLSQLSDVFLGFDSIHRVEYDTTVRKLGNRTGVMKR